MLGMKQSSGAANDANMMHHTTATALSTVETGRNMSVQRRRR